MWRCMASWNTVNLLEMSEERVLHVAFFWRWQCCFLPLPFAHSKQEQQLKRTRFSSLWSDCDLSKFLFYFFGLHGCSVAERSPPPANRCADSFILHKSHLCNFSVWCSLKWTKTHFSGFTENFLLSILHDETANIVTCMESCGQKKMLAYCG